MKHAWLAGLALVPGIAIGTALAETNYSPEMEALLKEEKAGRKACKVEMCSALRNKAAGADINCPIVKTVPKEDLSEKIKRAKVSWPWGHARCEMKLNVSRKVLIDAVSEPAYQAKFAAHTVICTVEREKKEPYEFKATVTPAISFKDGKAVDGSITWGKIEAPIVAKSVLWPATALDNKIGVFNDDLVEAMNVFMTKKCDEVKADWKS
ncbi:MAG: hypothetical protein ACR2O4_13430 [Hyphomicrobiaceae bacterium]